MARSNRDPVAAAVAATDKEMFAEALGGEDTILDETGDRSLEKQDDGLEGRIEDDIDADDADEPEGDAVEATGDEPDAETDKDAEESDGEPSRDEQGRFAKKDETVTNAKPAKSEPSVPPSRLREATERTRAVEAERDQDRQRFAQEQSALKAQLDLLTQQITLLQRVPHQQQQPQNQAPVDAEPDMFADPEGWRAWNRRQQEQSFASIRDDYNRRMINMNLAAARETHGERFDAAFNEITQAAQSEPEARLAIQRIWNAANPGGELMRWHRDRETLRAVGSDPEAYRKRIAEETRAALLQDPEFRKEIVASLRTGNGVAQQAGQGARHVVRTPGKPIPSLNGSSGSSRVAETVPQTDQELFDDALSP